MSDVSQILVEERITWQGKEYRILPPSLKTRGLFCAHLARNAIRFVRQNKEAYGDDFLTALDRVSRKGGSHGFAWGEEAWQEALRTDEGYQELALLVLQQSHPEFTMKMVLDLWDAPGGHYIDRDTEEEREGTLGAELVQKIWKLITRPNSPRPEVEPGNGA